MPAVLNKLLLPLLLLVGTVSLFAQTINLDSLKRDAYLTKDSVARFRDYYYVSSYELEKNPIVAALYADSAQSQALLMRRADWLCKTYKLKGLVAQKKNDPVLAMHWYEQALTQAQKHGDVEEECMILVNMAALCVESGDLTRAIDLYNTFKNRAAAIGNSSEALRTSRVTVQVGLGIVYKNQNKLVEAAEATKEGLALAIRYGYKNRIWDFYDNLGLIYGRMGDTPSKLMYHRKALLTVQPADANIAVIYNNLANAFLNLNQLDSAAYYYQKAADDPRTKWKSRIHTYSGLSQVSFEKGRYTEALEWAEKAIPLAVQTGNALTMVAAKTKKAKALMGLKRYDESIAVFQELQTLMDTNKEFAFVEERSLNKKYLAQAMALKNGAPQVAELIDEYSKGRDSIHNFMITHAIENSRVQFETRQKEDSIRLLQVNHNLQQTKLSRYRISLFGGFLLAITLLALLFYIRRQRRLERNILEIQNAQLRSENAAFFGKIQQFEKAAPTRTLRDFANESIVLNGNEKTVFRIGDILYIQSQGNGVQVVTPDSRVWRWQTMRNLEEALPNPPFLRTHRSYLINGMHIRQYRASQLTLANGDVIPVGITQTPHVEAFLRQWLPELA